MYGTTDFYQISEMAKSGNFEQIGSFLSGMDKRESYDDDHRNIPASSADCQDRHADMGRTKTDATQQPSGFPASVQTSSSSTKPVLKKAPPKELFRIDECAGSSASRYPETEGGRSVCGTDDE